MIETYRFSDLDGIYQFTSQTDDANYLPFKHSPLVSTGNIFADDFNLAIAADRQDEQPWVKWANGADAGKVDLTLMQGSDIVYRGSLVSVSVGLNNLAFSFTSRLKVRKGIRRRYQRGCNYQLYEQKTCNAGLASQLLTVTAITNNEVTTSTITNHADYLNGQISYRVDNAFIGQTRTYWITAVPNATTLVLNMTLQTCLLYTSPSPRD